MWSELSSGGVVLKLKVGLGRWMAPCMLPADAWEFRSKPMRGATSACYSAHSLLCSAGLASRLARPDTCMHIAHKLANE